MSTLANLVEEVLLNLEGFGALQDTIALASAGSLDNATGYTLITLTSPQLTDTPGITPTMLEVQDELMYVATASFSSPNLVCSVRRGYRGTPQATFGSPEYARVNPRFPQLAVKRAINGTIEGLFPRLVVVKTASVSYTANRFRYDLPADARNVLAVSVPDPSNPSQWHPSRYWSFDETGGASDASVRSVEVRDGTPGQSFRVVYVAEPTTLANNSSLFSSTGLPDWAREIVVFGACWRLASFMEAVSPMGATVEQTMLNEGQEQSIGRQNVARYFLGMFEARLAEGESRLQTLYPVLRSLTPRPAPQAETQEGA